MRKIQLKSSVCINSYMRIDKWGDTYWVDDYTLEYGGLIQFYKGGYILFCLGKNDFRYILILIMFVFIFILITKV